MKFSTKFTYGIRSMINLAKNDIGQPVSVSSIAEFEKISQKYLERIFSSLKKSGLVDSAKGVAGGYSLVKKPDEITVYDIVNALEGKNNVLHCINEQGKVYCQSNCHCQADDAMAKIQNEIYKNLKNIKLSQFL